VGGVSPLRGAELRGLTPPAQILEIVSKGIESSPAKPSGVADVA
jgi:hypothetical protein